MLVHGAAGVPGTVLPDRLIAELSAAQERSQAEPLLPSTVEDKAQPLAGIPPVAAGTGQPPGHLMQFAAAARIIAGPFAGCGAGLRPRRLALPLFGAL